MESLIAPFDAYKGDKPYIFVSYAHRNSKVVFRHITRLRDEGFRIWYDEGIDPGTDWSDEIAKALTNATSFLVFVSPEMVESHNVKKEIVFALSKKKQMIAVHIAETTLPPGLEMQLSNIQALLENRFNDKEKFYERFFAALPAAARIDPPSLPSPPPPQEQRFIVTVNMNDESIKKGVVNNTPTKFTPKTISLQELNVIHSPLNEKDYFHSSAKVMESINPPMMLQMNEWLYFSNPKDFKLYKIKINGENLSRVSKGAVFLQFIFNGYIYFVDNGRNNRIFRTNGSECKMFIDEYIEFFTLTPQGLVYSQRGYAGNPFMASSPAKYILVNYEGNIINEENFFVPELYSDGNYVFFTKVEEGASFIYRSDFDGTNVMKVCDEYAARIIGFSNGFIYFINKDDNDKLYKIHADGSQLTDLGFSENFNLAAISSDCLYYNNMYTGIIKRYLFEKKEDELLLTITGKATNTFCVIGNWMFILIESREQKEIEYYLCRMSLCDSTFETIATL